jgi:hypothetical protein
MEDAVRRLARVHTPGGQTAKFSGFHTDTAVPLLYRNDPRFQGLASDPAAAGMVTVQGRREAIAGLEAEQQGLVKPPLERGPARIEFYDGDGMPYDVKTPPSPSPDARWSFNARKAGRAIVAQLQQRFPNKITGEAEFIRVILDSSYLSVRDHQALWAYLNTHATDEELSYIIEVNTRI